MRHRYRQRAVKHRDLLPNSINGEDPTDYMISRTMMRPRDIITFLNDCIELAVDRPVITAEMVRQAEGTYSRNRLRSLADEWSGDYASLLTFTEVLKGRPASFAVWEIETRTIEDLCLDAVAKGFVEADPLSADAGKVTDGALSPESFRRTLVQAFYRIGLVGLKLETFESTVWSLDGRRSVSMAEIVDSTRI